MNRHFFDDCLSSASAGNSHERSCAADFWGSYKTWFLPVSVHHSRSFIPYRFPAIVSICNCFIFVLRVVTRGMLHSRGVKQRVCCSLLLQQEVSFNGLIYQNSNECGFSIAIQLLPWNSALHQCYLPNFSLKHSNKHLSYSFKSTCILSNWPTNAISCVPTTYCTPHSLALIWSLGSFNLANSAF